MEESILLRTYSVADLKDWLIHNHPKEGLSPSVIAPARAYAISHNPYVRDDMKVVCAVFVNEKVVAYTAAFPEIFQKPEGRLAWWFTTLWCDPAFEGRGYGLVVVGTLVEEYGLENCFDAEGAPETVEIMSLLGMKTQCRQRYVFSRKKICADSLRGKIAWCLDKWDQVIHYPCLLKCRKTLGHSEFSIVYQQYMDDDAFSFVLTHSHKDVILRRQETFNWILQYPFMQTAILAERTLPENQFSSQIKSYQSSIIKIYAEGALVGVALLVFRQKTECVKYLYYQEAYASIVFSAIFSHGLKAKVEGFETGNKSLASFVQTFHIYPKFTVLNYSFSTPLDFVMDDGMSLQSGEGDMFV